MSTPYLTALLYAPLASFGGLAVGERRISERYPTRSQLIGLLGAALGVDRADEEAQAALRDSCRFALQIFAAGTPGTDYHTVQSPSRGKTPFTTRRDELRDKQNLNTLLTSREYRYDFLAGLAISAPEGAAFPLRKVLDALSTPHYTLSLGRKSCPLGLPLLPEIAEAQTPQAALAALWNRIQQSKLINGREKNPVIDLLKALKAKPGDVVLERAAFVDTAQPHQLIKLRDQPVSRRHWQFDTREAVILTPSKVAS